MFRRTPVNNQDIWLNTFEYSAYHTWLKFCFLKWAEPLLCSWWTTQQESEDLSLEVEWQRINVLLQAVLDSCGNTKLENMYKSIAHHSTSQVTFHRLLSQRGEQASYPSCSRRGVYCFPLDLDPIFCVFPLLAHFLPLCSWKIGATKP